VCRISRGAYTGILAALQHLASPTRAESRCTGLPVASANTSPRLSQASAVRVLRDEGLVETVTGWGAW
jgi:hypothetical protein